VLKPEPPKPEPEEEDQFAALLKSVEDLERKTASDVEQEGEGRVVEGAGITDSKESGEAVKLTFSEIDGLKSQISRCWTLPAGIDGNKIRGMVVKLRIEVRPDRTVQRVSIVDSSGLDSDPTYRTVAESALRAVDRCGTLNLPEDKYDLWRDIVMTFRPEDAVNG
jgi:hypothetical protein